MKTITGKAIKKPIPVDFILLEDTLSSYWDVYIFLHGTPPYAKDASHITKEKWWEYCTRCGHNGYMPLKTLESGQGTQNANIGDYILKGIYGECWPIKADIFERTYDIVNP